MKHKFPYNWNLKDANFTKDKGKVFSCFACGGGSTMGYKLAGFDVIGHNDIDKKMIEVYKENHKPKYSFLESITTFAKRKDLPKELYELDILDGSPPCSSFSMAGNREKDWGKEKVFREGQAEQVLDTLFFDFIDLAKELQPKVVVAENVKGLLMGEAKQYVIKIYDAFDKAGYYCQHFLLDASKMGVPQRRERVFFICLRKDLAKPFLHYADMFTKLPKIEMEFNEKEILFGEYRDEIGLDDDSERSKLMEFRIKSDKCISDINERIYKKF
jgi:DNA (cytosine-5)-methyltransferase 1